MAEAKNPPRLPVTQNGKRVGTMTVEAVEEGMKVTAKIEFDPAHRKLAKRIGDRLTLERRNGIITISLP